MPRASAGLVLATFLMLGPAGGQTQETGSTPNKSRSIPASFSVRQLHKLRVTDQTTASLIAQRGGELIADYGSFELFAVDASTAEAFSRFAGVEKEDRQNEIELNAGVLDTSTPGMQSRRALVPAFAGKRLHLIQFAGPVQPEWRAELERSGVRIVAYVPQNAFLVYGDTDSVNQMQTWARTARQVQWDGDYADNYKIHPRAWPVRNQGGSVTAATDLFAIQLVEDPTANSNTLQLIDRIQLAPIRRQFRNLGYLNVIVRLPPDQLATVAAQPELVSIHPYAERKKFDERQDVILADDLTSGLPNGPGYLAWLASKGFTQEQFDASGFVVDVSDSGIDNGTTAPGHFGLYPLGNTSQSSRVVYSRLVGTPHSGSTLTGCDGHGTLNAHIIAGYNDEASGFPHTDSAGFHYGLGVCPFVELGASVIFDPDLFTSPDYPNLQSQAYHDGARISANSWGASAPGDYDMDAQTYDSLVRDAQPAGSPYASVGNQQMVIVFAAGNDGPDPQTVGSPGTAKNVITVGAAENVRSLSAANGGDGASGYDGCNKPDTSADNANDVADFSSRGPCADGRAKPDLVAPGTHVTGGVPQNSPPPSPSGSGSAISCFSADGVCGLPGSGTTGNANNFFPLGQEFYTTSSGTSHSTPAIAGCCALLRQYFINLGLDAPSPAMTKAYLMNSARYLSGYGASDSLWSDTQGMGEADLAAAFDGVSRVLHDQLSAEKFTAPGQVRRIAGVISDPSRPFRVTLAWTDAPGSTVAAKALKNDLDLAVIVNGIIYKGNVFSGAYSVPGGTADSLNNVESVFLPAGVSGDFAVTITAADINSDGVPNESPTADQDFALVVYNANEASIPILQVESTTLVAESCTPTNGAIDPGETVTVGFTLRNVGSMDTTNLLVTLLATNGVSVPSDPENYGALLAGGVAVTRDFKFTAEGACGGNITATFRVTDGAADLGLVVRKLTLGAFYANTISFTNPASIMIPASGTSGAGGPYPSTVTVSGLTATPDKVTVTLRGLNHTYPDDLDVLLVGPTGQKVLLMSDCGGSDDLNGITLTFDDSAASSLPDFSLITSGTYKPSNYDTTTDNFSAPAPGSPYGSSLSVFNGQNANGTWSLYIMDDAAIDVGSLAQGWSLSITTSNVACCTQPVTDLGISATASAAVVNLGSNVTFSLNATNHGPDTASAPVVIDVLPAGFSFANAAASQGTWTNDLGVVSFYLGAMTNSATATITVEGMATAAGTWTNRASVFSDAFDSVSTNNSALLGVIINSPPTISDITDARTDENLPLGPIAFTIGDAETPAASLVLSADSSDTNLVPVGNIQLGGTNANRTLTVIPAPGLSGITTITITVADGLASAFDSFDLTVTATNHSPTLSVISDFEILPGTMLGFTNLAADVDSPPQALVFSLSNAPAGATIDSATGIFSWTPVSVQGGTTNLISVIVTDDGVPSQSAIQKFTVVVLKTNSPPVLQPVPDRTIFEHEALLITNNATDPDLPADTLTFNLGTNAPAGAQINLTNGIFSWIPDETQGGTTNRITISIADDGVPSLSDTQSFTVVVLESNSPPSLNNIMDRILHAGSNLVFTNTATDPDLPTNVLSFSLDAGAPPGASITTNGVFSWPTSESNAGTTNNIIVRVTDNGVPPLSDAKSFAVAVLPRPIIKAVMLSNNMMRLSWSAIPNQIYRVEYRTNLLQTNWTELSPDVTAHSQTATNRIDLGPEPERYYRIRLVP